MSGVVCPPPELSFGAEYYSVVNGVCTRDESFFGGKPVLAQAVGYAVVIGFGAFFALFTSFLVRTPKSQSLCCHYHNQFTNQKQENFN
jgi:hypothetical protein